LRDQEIDLFLSGRVAGCHLIHLCCRAKSVVGYVQIGRFPGQGHQLRCAHPGTASFDGVLSELSGIRCWIGAQQLEALGVECVPPGRRAGADQCIDPVVVLEAVAGNARREN
jgi:hypothetical protein